MTTLISSHPSAPEGAVLSLGQYEPKDFIAGSVILCRNTAPLVGFAYSLLLRDIPCRILGRDIGVQLATLVKKMRAVSLPDLRAKLAVWSEREVARCAAEDTSPERIYDQRDCLNFFIASLDESSQGVPDLLAKIDLLFTDDGTNSSTRITLSTIHKSKGLEYPTVFILDFTKLQPSRFAKLSWQKEQETNLIYVAITRAMERLVYINSDNWKTES